MNECLQCKKELVHVEGRRKKIFCSDTCRSNYWYAKNVKNQPKKLPLPKDFIDHKGNMAAVNQNGEVVIPNVANQVKIQAYEEELKNVPENTTLGKRRIAWLKSEIYKLKSNPSI